MADNGNRNDRNSGNGRYDPNRTGVNGRAGAQYRGRPSQPYQDRQANAPRAQMTDKQREAYERAYFQRYGVLPPLDSEIYAEERGRDPYYDPEREKRIKEAAARRRAEDRRRAEWERRERMAAQREEKRFREREREYTVKKRDRENLADYKQKRARLEEERKRERERKKIAEAARREAAKRRRRRKKVFKFHLRIFAAAFAVFAALAIFVIYKTFFAADSGGSGSVSYYFDDSKAYSASSETAYCNGKICINFSDMAERYGFYVYGDSTSLKFVIPESEGSATGDTVEFIIGSNTASINDTPVSLETDSRYIGSSLWVSCSVGDYFENGIKIETSGSGRVNVSRVKKVDDKGNYVRDANKNYVYEAVTLSCKPMFENESIDFVAVFGDDAKGFGKGSDVTFKADLTAYEQYMNPADSNEFLILVSDSSPLDVTYLPDDLMNVSNSRADGRAVQRLRKNAAMALDALFIELNAQGFKGVTVTSGFVSYNEQANFYAKSVGEEMAAHGYTEAQAKIVVSAYCDEAGTNDLQSGLSAVFHDMPYSSIAFANEPVYKWLKDNVWKFGFVERYPLGKSDITGHAFDPCHYRYVGRYVAEIIYKNGGCLEEFLNGDLNIKIK